MVHAVVMVDMLGAVEAVGAENARRVHTTVAAPVRIVVRPENSTTNLLRRLFL